VSNHWRLKKVSVLRNLLLDLAVHDYRFVYKDTNIGHWDSDSRLADEIMNIRILFLAVVQSW
jgi:hypothetical protein